jgi:hypothetical protein
MAMDLSAIKSRLAALQSQKQPGQKRDMSLVLWKPTVGKHSIRIVPSMYDKQVPFKEVFIHYGIGKRTMIALSNFGEKDPIVQFVDQLRTTQSKENWSLAKKLEPKTRIFAPVIVRGEEDKGVRLWEFGKQVYMELLSIAEDEDVGDYTDPINGRDLTIETTDAATNGTGFNQSKVRVRTKVTPLTEDSNQLKSWLTQQPEVFSLYKKYEYEEMKAALVEFINPEESIDEVAPSAAASDHMETGLYIPPTESAPAEQKPSYGLNTSAAKTSQVIDDEFDKLFN